MAAPPTPCALVISRWFSYRGPRAGEMAERLKAHAWKACVRESVPRVRIPVSPPFFAKKPQKTATKYRFDLFGIHLGIHPRRGLSRRLPIASVAPGARYCAGDLRRFSITCLISRIAAKSTVASYRLSDGDRASARKARCIAPRGYFLKRE
jgi:hypothetical protein